MCWEPLTPEREEEIRAAYHQAVADAAIEDESRPGPNAGAAPIDPGDRAVGDLLGEIDRLRHDASARSAKVHTPGSSWEEKVTVVVRPPRWIGAADPEGKPGILVSFGHPSDSMYQVFSLESLKLSMDEIRDVLARAKLPEPGGRGDIMATPAGIFVCLGMKHAGSFWTPIDKAEERLAEYVNAFNEATVQASAVAAAKNGKLS